MALMSLRSRSHVNVVVLTIHGVNESRSFLYTQLYKITSKYCFKTYRTIKIYCNGPDEPRGSNPRPTACVFHALANLATQTVYTVRSRYTGKRVIPAHL